MVIFNIEVDPIKKEHICYYVEYKIEIDGKRYYILYEVERVFYPHPEAPEHAMVDKIETKVIKKVLEISTEAAPLRLAIAMQDTLKMIFK